MKQFTASFFAVCILFATSTAYSQDTLTILHFNDTHSTLSTIGSRDAHLEGTLGGIARAATLIGETRMTDPNVLVLHAGDVFIGDIFFNVYFGAAELKMMTALGFDAMTLGNHEFDLTPAVLMESLNTAFADGGFPLLSANLILPDTSVLPLKKFVRPFIIKQAGNVKVGIFGLTTPETNLLSQPSPAILDTNILPIATAMVESLKTHNCRVIICLSHLGIALDEVLAASVPGIHVIIGGHDHTKTEAPVRIDNASGPTWIVQANAFYLDAGKMRLIVNNGNVQLLDDTLIPLDSNVPEEPTTKAIVDSLKTEIDAIYAPLVGPFFSKQISYASETLNEVADSLTTNGNHDTPIGNLVTDAFRAATHTDIAVEVGGSTAQPLYKGPIVADDLFRVVGYGFNTENGLGFRIATFEMLGADILAGLEFGLSNIEANDEFLMQTSGLTYVYNAHYPPYSRVTQVLINNEPLDPQRTYTVTSNEFTPQVMQQLGINFSNLKILHDTTEFMVLLAYVSQFDTLKLGVTGRIHCLNSPVGVEENSRVELPRKFSLKQNYPNPFNPTTNIRFEVPVSGFVTLKVYDVMGRKIALLVNEKKSPGTYEVLFDCSKLPSGIYFYRLEAEGFVETKKMILLR